MCVYPQAPGIESVDFEGWIFSPTTPPTADHAPLAPLTHLPVTFDTAAFLTDELLSMLAQVRLLSSSAVT